MSTRSSMLQVPALQLYFYDNPSSPLRVLQAKRIITDIDDDLDLAIRNRHLSDGKIITLLSLQNRVWTTRRDLADNPLYLEWEQKMNNLLDELIPNSHTSIPIRNLRPEEVRFVMRFKNFYVNELCLEYGVNSECLPSYIRRNPLTHRERTAMHVGSQADSVRERLTRARQRLAGENGKCI